MKLKHITLLVASTFVLGACNQSKTASEQEAQTPQTDTDIPTLEQLRLSV